MRRIVGVVQYQRSGISEFFRDHTVLINSSVCLSIIGKDKGTMKLFFGTIRYLLIVIVIVYCYHEIKKIEGKER